MSVSAYTIRSARPRIGPEPETAAVAYEPREPMVPVFTLTPIKTGVFRVSRRMVVAAWKRVAQ